MSEQVALLEVDRRRAVVTVSPLTGGRALLAEGRRPVEDMLGRKVAVVVEMKEDLALHRVDLARAPGRAADEGRVEVRDFGAGLHRGHVGREDDAEDSVFDL